ncbi:hypothetical protein QQS21_001640 [Conoideocrella luteorostrata]|uniref:Uncharacterized protein n=1 Tax=Conoideocrella luteorostrata TaxID=1105319 RepID=A0AAJ0G3C4_9HYPO|nr:hypothetical protein QQS21_001640 [Conoideocrella luteorostrata]
MRKPILLITALSSVVPNALAGGVHGCMERITAWQAYEVDGLRPEADQTIGFKCVKWEEIDGRKKGQCKDDHWTRCKSKGQTRCHYDDFIRFLGKHPGGKNWQVLRPDGSMDIEASSKKCVDAHKAKNQKTYNFPAYNVNKKTTHNVFERYVLDLAKSVDNTVQVVNTPAAQEKAAQFDRTSKRVLELRVGDHGAHAIDDAKAKLGGQMHIYTRDVGMDFGDNSKQMKAVDWHATAKAAIASSVPNVQQTIKTYHNGFYGDVSPKTHRSVVRSYKTAEKRSHKCRG